MSGFDWFPQLKSLWTAWFFLVFGLILVRVLWPGSRARLQRHAQIPLRDSVPIGGKPDEQ